MRALLKLTPINIAPRETDSNELWGCLFSATRVGPQTLLHSMSSQAQDRQHKLRRASEDSLQRERLEGLSR